EKRVEKIEKGGTSNEMVKELVDVVRTNQKIIDEVVKINSEMINKVSDLSAKVTELTEKMNDFLQRVEIGEHQETAPVAAEERRAPENEERIQKLEKRINSLLLSTMKAKQIRPTTMVRRPMPA
ncbi:MAG: hypothetical protein HY517_00960, partial [Candidatus Aenigmarchaeota archaeon]|nr:hypothetical protein [Candidatus Aenigmarchaeota archaeon]